MAAKRSDEEEWQRLLVDGHGSLVRMRHIFRLVPSPPRCKLCNNPFEGVGGRIVGLAGFRRSRKNPNFCSRCCDGLPQGGAEVDIAVLFADVRGSTALGEKLPAAELAALLNRFYDAATTVLIKHDAVVDMIGDGVMALFVPGIAGPGYRQAATDAGLELLAALGYGSAEGPWLPVGAGVCAGTAFVGNVGSGEMVDFTALGDPVNVAARLQSEAAGGELVVAGDGPDARAFDVRGREQPVTAHVLKL
jgi:adenylate cyclase